MDWAKNISDIVYKDDKGCYSTFKFTGLWACIWLLLAVGLFARVSPLFDIDHRLFWQLMTEDGYLMQTVARNMAIGLGMSTADGTIPTNGVQPLATFLYALLHYIAGGSKLLAIAYLTVFSAITALMATWLYHRLILRLLDGWPFATPVALLSAALWFASPLVIGHSTNGLETGVYYLAIIATLLYYNSINVTSATSMTNQQRVTFGVMLGVTFLARNDAVFFIAALLAAHSLIGGMTAGGGYRQRFVDSLVAGIVSIVIASPWLIYNKLMFGSIVPISGAAESADAAFGMNMRMIPANLLEAALLYVPVPRAMETTWPVFIIASLILIALLWGFWTFFASRSLRGRRFFLAMLIFVICIGGYYGLFFGAPHFITRYLSSLSPFLWVASYVTALIFLAGIVKQVQTLKRLWVGVTVLMLLVTTLMAEMSFTRGTNFMHKQVVDWVTKNVHDQQWVGAVQTGTLGYFHDRTINLDGKTNPAALKARIKTGNVFDYVLDETSIEYLVDWESLCGWVDQNTQPRFGESFHVVLHDQSNNLCVLHRVQ